MAIRVVVDGDISQTSVKVIDGNPISVTPYIKAFPEVNVSVSDTEQSVINVAKEVAASVRVNEGLVVIEAEPVPFEGYEAVSGDEDQTINIKVTIKKIPSNYGKILWNGAYLTIV